MASFASKCALTLGAVIGGAGGYLVQNRLQEEGDSAPEVTDTLAAIGGGAATGAVVFYAVWKCFCGRDRYREQGIITDRREPRRYQQRGGSAVATGRDRRLMGGRASSYHRLPQNPPLAGNFFPASGGVVLDSIIEESERESESDARSVESKGTTDAIAGSPRADLGGASAVAIGGKEHSIV